MSTFPSLCCRQCWSSELPHECPPHDYRRCTVSSDTHSLGDNTDSISRRFTEFATFLLHSPSFTWTIYTNKLRVTALGTAFDGVSLSKDVNFKAFNGFPGVTISNFQLPYDDPAGGIHIETDSLIPSPARLCHQQRCRLHELTRLSRARYRFGDGWLPGVFPGNSNWS